LRQDATRPHLGAQPQCAFAIGDATTLTEAGYSAKTVENLLPELLPCRRLSTSKRPQAASVHRRDRQDRQRPSQNVSITRDVPAKVCSKPFLKMLEGTTAMFRRKAGVSTPSSSTFQIDTTNILFIAAATFTGVDDIIRKRLGSGRRLHAKIRSRTPTSAWKGDGPHSMPTT